MPTNFHLRWQHGNPERIDHFEIYRSINGGSYELIGTAQAAASQEFTDPDVDNTNPAPPSNLTVTRSVNNGVISIQLNFDSAVDSNDKYEYRVYAVDANGKVSDPAYATKRPTAGIDHYEWELWNLDTNAVVDSGTVGGSAKGTPSSQVNTAKYRYKIVAYDLAGNPSIATYSPEISLEITSLVINVPTENVLDFWLTNNLEISPSVGAIVKGYTSMGEVHQVSASASTPRLFVHNGKLFLVYNRLYDRVAIWNITDNIHYTNLNTSSISYKPKYATNSNGIYLLYEANYTQTLYDFQRDQEIAIPSATQWICPIVDVNGKIMAAVPHQNHGYLSVYDHSTGQQSIIVEKPVGEIDACNHNNQLWVAGSNKGDSSHLFIYSPSIGFRELNSGTVYDTHITSFNGKLLVFYRNQSDGQNMYVYDYSTGKHTSLQTGRCYSSKIAQSSDNIFIVGSNQLDNYLFAFDYATRTKKQITDSSVADNEFEGFVCGDTFYVAYETTWDHYPMLYNFSTNTNIQLADFNVQWITACSYNNEPAVAYLTSDTIYVQIGITNRTIYYTDPQILQTNGNAFQIEDRNLFAGFKITQTEPAGTKIRYAISNGSPITFYTLDGSSWIAISSTDIIDKGMTKAQMEALTSLPPAVSKTVRLGVALQATPSASPTLQRIELRTF